MGMKSNGSITSHEERLREFGLSGEQKAPGDLITHLVVTRGLKEDFSQGNVVIREEGMALN